jgi:hypothetical protein
MTVTGFSYQGVQTIGIPAGSISVMVFAIAGASWTSLCLGTPPVVMRSGPGSASGVITLRAVTFSATVGATPVSFTVSSPPGSAQPLPGGSGTLTGVSADVIGLTVPGAALADATMGRGSC